MNSYKLADFLNFEVLKEFDEEFDEDLEEPRSDKNLFLRESGSEKRFETSSNEEQGILCAIPRSVVHVC